MSAFLAAFRLELRSRVVIVYWATLCLCLIATGPYGTYVTFTLLERALICVPFLAALMLVVTVIHLGVGRVMGGRGWAYMLLVAAVSAVVLAPVTLLVLHLLVPSSAMNYPGLGELGLLVGSSCLGFSALRSLTPEDPEPVAEPEASTEARILQRLDPELRGDLLAISVSDHYVEVITSAGKARVLLRLSDAITETAPIEGAQVHRSHWVAWDAVQAVERDGTKLFLRLTHGDRVPVSKNHRDKVEKRGLI